MNASTRFTIALHVLTLLASGIRPKGEAGGEGGGAVTSEFIASSVNTNPVVIRRILGLLRKRGWVGSQPGTGGGWRLLQPAEKLTLREVRRAVEEASVFALHSQAPNPKCMVGRNIQAALESVYGAAERAMEEKLAEETVASLLRRVERGSRKTAKR